MEKMLYYHEQRVNRKEKKRTKREMKGLEWDVSKGLCMDNAMNGQCIAIYFLIPHSKLLINR